MSAARGGVPDEQGLHARRDSKVAMQQLDSGDNRIKL